MKIGDRVFVRGYIDEIRKDTVIIRNAGGYFGTIPSEVITGELPSAQPEQKVGKWIIKDNPGTGWYRVTCSECGEDVTSEIRLIGFIPNCKALWDYCPYCGAKMEEQDE